MYKLPLSVAQTFVYGHVGSFQEARAKVEKRFPSVFVFGRGFSPYRLI